MLERFGNVIYWAAILLGIVLYGLTGSDGSAFIAGIVVTAVGWAIRYILTGKKTIKP